jgi:cytosine/adenosine deaminase-related metal-dependent hydrolase
MHLLETVYQRAWADANFPQGMVRYLRDIGFLSERLTLAHCIHAGPDELDMIAESGARIVTNFSSNMHLASGLAPIAAAHKCGCAIAVGVDGLALDEDDDVLREMRLVQLMHGVGFKRTGPAPGSLGSPFAMAAAHPARREQENWRPERPRTSSLSISIGSIATRSCPSIRSRCYLRGATRRCCKMWLSMGG